MAKQDGFHPVIGTLGKTTFYRTKDGYFAKEKSNVPAGRMFNDPRFERQRDHIEEFSRAGKAGKLIRDSLNTELLTMSDKKLLRRMTALLLQVVKSDPVNGRGKRTVEDGDLSILKDFDFNDNSVLSAIFKAPVTVNYDRSLGIVTVDHPSFVPGEQIKAPVGATHFKLITGAGEYDFKNGVWLSKLSYSNLIPYNKIATGDISLSANITPDSDKAVFIFRGINYYEEVNGVQHLLTSGAFNALKIVEVNTI